MYLPSYLELFTVDLLHDRVSLGTFPCFILDIMVALKCRSMKSRSKFHVQVEEEEACLVWLLLWAIKLWEVSYSNFIMFPM